MAQAGDILPDEGARRGYGPVVPSRAETMIFAPAATRAPWTISTLSYVALGMASLVGIQGLLDSSELNIYCSILCAAATAVVLLYCFRRKVIGQFPLSTFAVFGFCVTNYALPLVAQTLDGKPLIYNLIAPRPAFGATIQFQAVILLAHYTYTHIRPLRRASQWLGRSVLRPLWIFRYPLAGELWLLGLIGLGATWISRILYVGDVDFGNVGGKFLQALVPFIVAPLFIPFRPLFLARSAASGRATVPLLVGYFLVVVITAIAFNARAIFAVVLFTVLLASVLMLAVGRLKLSGRQRIVLAATALAAIPLITVAQNLATAMQVARGLRGTGGTGDIVAETFHALQDPESLERWRAAELAKTSTGGYSGYSEIYLDSEFLQRLTYTKYTDLTISASLQLSDYQRAEIRSIARQQIISILPTPLITLIGFDVDKSNLVFSTGDIYAEFAFDQARGGQRTGSSITNTIDVLGSLWPPITFLIFIATFILLDSYSLNVGGRVMLSTLSFILLYEIFARSLTYDSFRNLVDGITRSYVQALFVYTVLTVAARLAVALIWRSRPEARYLQQREA